MLLVSKSISTGHQHRGADGLGAAQPFALLVPLGWHAPEDLMKQNCAFPWAQIPRGMHALLREQTDVQVGWFSFGFLFFFLSNASVWEAI